MSKPSLPQGTRDFGPETVRKRNYILYTIQSVFELYGFQPLETPAMENLETLTGKYGEEGDKLIFKILNNGLGDPKNLDKAHAGFNNIIAGKNDRNFTERALRYDLTIPFARYVAMNYGLMAFPFKRYQVQPVWRADRPQRGRYREFYQCDADVVGSTSLLNEVELVHLYNDVFLKLQLGGYELKINSRKILLALAEKCGGSDRLTDITVAIDKLDKIGLDKVMEELSARGLDEARISIIQQYLALSGDNQSKLRQVRELLGNIEQAEKGVNELEFIFSRTIAGIPLHMDLTLARGLNYYTGTIFEVKAPAQIKIGSIGGGGRYDDLTGLFGVKDVPGVGISFGVDRIYDVLEEMNLFPGDINVATQVMFYNTGEKETRMAFGLMQSLRSKGIRTEIFHENQKIDKQYNFARKKNIPFVVTVIDDEFVELKNLRTGKFNRIPAKELPELQFLS